MSPSAPSVLVRGGTVFDGHRHVGKADVLVEGDRVVAVGTGLSGDEVVDAAFVSPGFVDAHVHPVQGGLERLRCDLSEGSTREEYLATIQAYADAHPGVDWILGGGWAMPAFPGGTQTAADVDKVTGGRPAYLPNRDHHGAWVNTRA